MQFGLTSEQQMLVESVRAFVDAELAPHEDEVERTDKVRPELIQQIKDKALQAGFYAANMPEDLGGGGLDHVGVGAHGARAGPHQLCPAICRARGRRTSCAPARASRSTAISSRRSAASGWNAWR